MHTGAGGTRRRPGGRQQAGRPVAARSVVARSRSVPRKIRPALGRSQCKRFWRLESRAATPEIITVKGLLTDVLFQRGHGSPWSLPCRCLRFHLSIVPSMCLVVPEMPAPSLPLPPICLSSTALQGSQMSMFPPDTDTEDAGMPPSRASTARPS